MKKKLAIGILSALLVVGSAGAAFGAGSTALDPGKLAEIKTLTQQMFGIKKQIVDKGVEAGAYTPEQADKMKSALDRQMQQSEKALDKGMLPGSAGLKQRPAKSGEAKGQLTRKPLTEEQVKAWKEKADERLKTLEAQMKKEGKLTEAQIKTWIDGARAQLSVQEEALKSGTFIPGAMGMMPGGGKGVSGKRVPDWAPGQRPQAGMGGTGTSPTANPITTN